MENSNSDLLARKTLGSLAVTTGLQVSGGRIRRTSSRFCLGVEHGDYNGTELFGVGSDRFLWLAHRPNGTDRVRLYSANFPADSLVDFKLGEVPPPKSLAIANTWARFPYGVNHVLRREGFKLNHGFDAILYSNIPGGGMSRSASLSLNLILTFLEVNDIRVPDEMKIVDLAQAVENDYIGSPCGNLDQIMIYFARDGMGTHYDPKTRSIRHVPLGEQAIDFRFVSLDTGTVRPGLEKSTYKIRRAECEELVALAGKGFGFSCLADIRDQALYDRIVTDYGKSHHISALASNTSSTPDNASIKCWRLGGQAISKQLARSSARMESACATITRFPVQNWKRCATWRAQFPASWVNACSVAATRARRVRWCARKASRR